MSHSEPLATLLKSYQIESTDRKPTLGFDAQKFGQIIISLFLKCGKWLKKTNDAYYVHKSIMYTQQPIILFAILSFNTMGTQHRNLCAT
jgi:hypothetical protein